MVGCVWNGFLLGRVRNQVLPCCFCGAPDSDGHLFWEAGLVQHFKAAILDAWRNEVAADLCGRKGFRGGPC